MWSLGDHVVIFINHILNSNTKINQWWYFWSKHCLHVLILIHMLKHKIQRCHHHNHFQIHFLWLNHCHLPLWLVKQFYLFLSSKKQNNLRYRIYKNICWSLTGWIHHCYLAIVYTKSKIALNYQKSANHTKKNEKCPLSLGEHYYVIKLHNLPLHLSNLKHLSWD